MVLVVVEGIDQGCTTSTVHAIAQQSIKNHGLLCKEEICLFLNREVLSSFSKTYTDWMRASHTTNISLHGSLAVILTARGGNTKMMI